MIILIPAYEPDTRLIDLLDSISIGRIAHAVVIVDDGSGRAYAPIFADCATRGAVVLRHPANRGKGAALKLGFTYIADHYPGHDVVCADCDGQHLPVDIGRVAVAVHEHPHTMVLGTRRFVGAVPRKSRFGNGLTRRVYRLATGHELYDTQTGLRGYSADLLEWLAVVRGERFEYELEVLLASHHDGIGTREVEIGTVYFDNNRSTHFRSVRDSVRVYLAFVRYATNVHGREPKHERQAGQRL